MNRKSVGSPPLLQQPIVQQVAAKAAIVRRGKILLLRESSKHVTNVQANKYQFPGGRLNPGELFLDGLSREVREETGIKIKIGEPFHVDEWFPIILGVPHHIIAIFVICQTPDDVPILSEEHDDYKWVDETNISEINVMQPDDRVAQLLFRRLSKVGPDVNG